MRISRRKGLLIAGIALIALLLLLVTSSPFQQWLLRRAESYAANAGFPFTARRLRLNFTDLQASLDGIVYDQNGQRFQVEHLLVDVPWNALRGDDIRITSVEADGVVVNIQAPEAPAKPTATQPTSASTTTKPRRVRIDRLAIRNVSLIYATAKATVTIPSLSLEATDGNGTIRMDAPASLGPEAKVAVAQIPFVFDNESVKFGPADWSVRYAKYDGSGSAQGVVRWSPALTVDAELSTNPLTLEKWKDIRLNAKASYADGALNISELRATQAGGELTGSAQIGEEGTATDLAWKNVTLDPSGFAGRTDGALNLMWSRSDFGDLAGAGHINLNSRDYGALQGDLRITQAKAAIDLRASAMDLVIRGQVTASLEPLLGGDLNVGGTVRGSIQPLSASPLYQRVETINVSAAAMFRDNAITVRDFYAKSKGSSVSGATLQANLTNRRLRGSVPEVRVEVSDFVPDAKGTVTLSADIGGTLDAPTASFMGSSSGVNAGKVKIDNIALSGDYADGLHGMLNGTLHPFTQGTAAPGLAAIDLSARATFKDNVVMVTDAVARSKSSLVSDGTFEVNLTDKQIRGNVPTVRIDLSDFAEEAHGVVNLAADIAGTMDQPTALFAGSSSGIDISGTHIDTVGVEGQFENSTLSLTRFEARQAAGLVSGTGSVNLTTEAVNAEAEVFDVKIVQVADLYAAAFLKAKVDGTYESPRINVTGEFRDVVYREEELGNIQLEGSADLTAASLRAKSEKYAATVVGDVTFQEPYPFTAALTSTKSNIRYDKYEVTASGQARLSGEAYPFKPKTLEFDEFKLRGEGIDLAANGSISTGVALNVDVDLADLPIEEIEMNGEAHAVATVRGALNDPSIEGTLTTENATVRVSPTIEPADVSAQVDFTGRDFAIRTLQATYAGATATITGNGTWQGAGQLQFRVDNIRPEKIAPERHLSGIASAEGELEVKSPRLEDISGHVKVTELDLNARDIAVHQIQPIEVELNNQVLNVRSFQVEGLQTNASIKGKADLRDRSLNLDAAADTDLAILEPLIPNSHPSGRIETRVALRGTFEKPSLDGFLNISNGELALENPDIVLNNLNVEGQLRDDRFELSRGDGMLNGGQFQVTGGTGLSAMGLTNTAFKVDVQRGQLEYPEGLQSEFSSQLALEGTMPNLTLRGTVDIFNAVYEKDFKITQALFARITAPPLPAAGPTSEGFSNQIRMEIDVRTQNPVLVKNNVANLEATGTFQVRGTVANPIILGRALVQEGGELYFGPAVSSQAVETSQRADRYAIERGSIDFNNPLRTEPQLDFRATHELELQDERYLITLEVTGTPETLKAELTSDPHKEQSDIISMLLTGRTFEELQGTYATVAGEQALSYVSGQLSAKVLSQAGNVLGLNTVRIDPVTVANQTDVAARLTIAKDITSDFSLIYSQNLNETQAQTWIASYQPFKRFVFRGISDGEQNEILFDLKHELRLGGGDPLLERIHPQNELKLRNVTFTGSSFSDKQLRKQVTKEGNPLGVYRVTQDVRNLRRFLASQGYPSARIQTQQNKEDLNVDVHFDITQGPKITFGYEGAEVPGSLQKEIEQVWTLRSSDEASLRDSTRRLLRYFRSEGYLDVDVSHDKSPSNASSSEERRYIFVIAPGVKYDKPKWVFHGIEPLDLHDPAGVVMEKPEAVKEQIESTLRSNGYLDVKSTTPNLVVEGKQAHFEVTVDQGKLYTVEKVEFEGNQAIDSVHLRDVVAKEASKKDKEPVRFTSDWLEAARRGVTSEYWKRGYNEVQIIPSTSSDPNLGQATIRFTIVEGEPQIVEAIEVTGAKVTSRGYINRQFEFKKGDPVDFTKINLTRKKLYDTRLFKRVDTEVVPGTNGYIAKIHLTENAPWQVRYGLSVTEHLEDGNRSVGVSADLSYNNLLGRAITTGISGKVNSDEKDGRVFASAPQFFGRKVTTSVTFFRTQDSTDPEDVVDYWGTTAQQQWRFREHYLLSYDYSYRKVLRGQRTVGDVSKDDGDTVLEDIRVPIARFGVILSHDTRDDILNATRGHFVSNSFEIAPPKIGSSVEYYRNFTQYFHFQPLKKIVLASGFRFGYAKSLEDEPLDPTLQYETGGGNTVRAFKQDELSKVPGNYELVLNQEVRFPLFTKYLSGVAFIDAGQVALHSEDIFNLRWGPGLGIRIHTPFVLLRVDLGININKRPEEDRGRWSFGIGQAF